MKISEAIRLGIGAVKERRDAWLTNNRQIEPTGPCGCAIGTALYAVGETDEGGYVLFGITECERVWPWTKNDSGSVKGLSIASEISHRHCKGESRESIAAWLETIEPCDPNEVSAQEQAKTVTVHVPEPESVNII